MSQELCRCPNEDGWLVSARVCAFCSLPWQRSPSQVTVSARTLEDLWEGYYGIDPQLIAQASESEQEAMPASAERAEVAADGWTGEHVRFDVAF